MATAYELSVNGSGPDRPVLSDAPSTVSVRRHLRNGVPDIYRRNATAMRDQPPPFAMRFLHALEEVLDPIVATLDSLPAHLDADLAPEHALGAWRAGSASTKSRACRPTSAARRSAAPASSGGCAAPAPACSSPWACSSPRSRSGSTTTAA